MIKGLAGYLYDGLDDAARIAAKKWLWGWRIALTALIIWIAWSYSGQMPEDIAPNNERNVHITNVLATEPTLATAIDICQDPNFKVGYYELDDHYQGQLIQNNSLPNEVRYNLFFREDRNLQIVIETTRTGENTETRTDPNTNEFWDCIADKDIQEVEAHP